MPKDETKIEPAKLCVIARSEGFRRAGRAWSVAPTEVETKEFSADQLAALRADPMLIVQDVK
jgi:hypothetical protein